MLPSHPVQPHLRRNASATVRRRAKMLDLACAVRELLAEGYSIGQVSDAVEAAAMYADLPTRRSIFIGVWLNFHDQVS